MKKIAFTLSLFLLILPLISEIMVIETIDSVIEIDLSEIENIEFMGLTSAENIQLISILNFQLKQNYPNPFNPSTNISFNLQNSGDINLEIYNLKGQKVSTLLDRKMNAGEHSITWMGKDQNGQNVASGVYFYKLNFSGVTQTKKMILLK